MQWRYRCLRCREWQVEDVGTGAPSKGSKAICRACCRRALREFWDLLDESNESNETTNEKETTMSRGGLHTVVNYFRTEDVDVATIALKHVANILEARQAQKDDSAAGQRKALDTPRRTRHTKAEVTGSIPVVGTVDSTSGVGEPGPTVTAAVASV